MVTKDYVKAKQNANTAIDALTQLNTPQKAKLKEQVGQANRLEDVQTVQTMDKH